MLGVEVEELVLLDVVLVNEEDGAGVGVGVGVGVGLGETSGEEGFPSDCGATSLVQPDPSELEMYPVLQPVDEDNRSVSLWAFCDLSSSALAHFPWRAPPVPSIKSRVTETALTPRANPAAKLDIAPLMRIRRDGRACTIDGEATRFAAPSVSSVSGRGRGRGGRGRSGGGGGGGKGDLSGRGYRSGDGALSTRPTFGALLRARGVEISPEAACSIIRSHQLQRSLRKNSARALGETDRDSPQAQVLVLISQ